MKRHLPISLGVALALAMAGQSLVGQSGQPAAASAGGPLDSLHFRQLGPASTAGRVSDLAVYEENPAIFYVGTAHSGIWKTVNAGTTFEPQLQTQGLMSIGDVAVSQSNPDLVWVGTGESNNRQSTSWGDGVYKSTDGGKTYVNMGLRTSKHINRIVIDPRDNNIVLVAATGSLWGPGGERGVYKTADGGKTWKPVLKVDDDTGANELAMDPSNSKIVYASTYQRRRTNVLHERRRARQRHLEVDRWRRHMDAAQGQWHPRRPAGPDRVRRLQETAEHPLRHDRRADGPRRRAWWCRRSRGRRALGRRGGSWRCAGGGPGRRRPARRRRPAEHPADRPLPVGRRGRDLAQGEQREPAADVLQPGPHRPERPRGGVPRRCRPAPDARRRQDDRHRRRGHDPRRRARASGSTRPTRTTC